VRVLTFVDGNLALAEGNVPTAESLLVARALMNATVYRHHVSRIAGEMLERASERLLDGTDLDVETFARMTDDELRHALREYDATAATARRLSNRDLYKRAIWVERDAVPDRVVGMDHEAVREAERDVADRAGVDSGHVLLDCPGEPSMPESTIRVVVSGEVRRLHEQSPLVEGLQASQEAQWRMGAYAPEAEIEAVAEATRAVLGLD
jgi:hypothetical protein